MKTTTNNELWTEWCSRDGLTEEDRMRLDAVDTVLTAYAKEHPNGFAIDNLDAWVLMPKSTSEIISELQPVMHLEQFDVVMWLRANHYPLVLGSSEPLQWAIYERRYIDD